MKAALVARLAPRLHRPARYQVVQSLKAAAAAIIAWALTGWWLEAPMALMAPWAAVALVQGTVYRSLRTAVQIVLMITAGTLLAAGAAAFTGNTMIAVVVALPLTTLLGHLAPVGGQGLYAPTTALFVLAYGSYSWPAVGHRLLETLVGAAVGIAVNALVLPPVHSLHVSRLASALPRDSAHLLRDLADGMEDYDASRAEQWHRSAKDLLAALSELYVGRGGTPRASGSTPAAASAAGRPLRRPTGTSSGPEWPTGCSPSPSRSGRRPPRTADCLALWAVPGTNSGGSCRQRRRCARCTSRSWRTALTRSSATGGTPPWPKPGRPSPP
ncbi:FUSC family protein [Streptomyces sp. Cmuel-A718b]|uniref:FUSC family protein n=1 Tax=Streptomyces sp. Cmuel-A718b TaxID=697328 RepID=UPI00081DE501|nr:FUSC family protein [Streptomyces sp. Cmuel-A718b]SCF92905.1 Aromatic acid exporter family member 1 [Streptomyces sp. Cmuel-A718b]